MAPMLGGKVNERRAASFLADLTPWLWPGEDVRLVVRTNRVNPLIDLVVITDRRVLGVGSFDINERGPKLVVALSDIVSWDVRMTLIDPRRLCLVTAAGEMSFGNLDKADVATVKAALAGQVAQAKLAS